MRVGGRLQNCNFNYDKNHPILLHSNHRLTELLFEYEHRRLFHAGPQMILSSIRYTYCPIRGRNLVRKCYIKGIRCCRMKGDTITPTIGYLPQQRLLKRFVRAEVLG